MMLAATIINELTATGSRAIESSNVPSIRKAMVGLPCTAERCEGSNCIEEIPIVLRANDREDFATIIPLHKRSSEWEGCNGYMYDKENLCEWRFACCK